MSATRLGSGRLLMMRRWLSDIREDMRFGSGAGVSHRPLPGRLGPDMADAEAARRAREAPVGDQRHLLAHALAIKCGSGRQHLAHAGAALGAFIADHDHRALGDLALLDRREALLLAIE